MKTLPNIWKQRTTLEKVLIILYLVIGTAILASIVVFFLIFSHRPEKRLCLTPGCINAAAKILNSIDESVHPCDNFYEFACGNFIKNTYIPDGKLAIDTFSDVSDKIEIQLKTILNEEIQANESKAFTLAKRLNKSCMNRTAVEALGLRPMKEILSSYGGWPAVLGQDWNETEWDWIDTIGKMRTTGLTTNYVLSTSIGPNFKNSSMRTLRIDQPEFGLSRSLLLNDDKTIKMYFDFMLDIAVIFGANRTNSQEELLQTLNFEKALANISTPNEERRDGEAQYNPHTIKDLHIKYPYLRWLDLINGLMPKSMPVTENEVIVVITPVYFERLAEVLKNTTKRTIANYFMWRSVLIASTFLNDQVRYRKLSYLGSVSDSQQTSTPQWKECIGYASSTLSVSVGALYVRKYFNENVRHRVVEMVENIRSSFINTLHNVSWMDETTKKAAIGKAKTLTAHIGYPDELTNNTKLEEYYSRLEIKSDEYFMNALRLNFFKTNYMYLQLHRPVNKTEWLGHSTPAVINAFYSAIENSIQFPAGILQGQFLASDRPEYLNYGAIGQIIGHEITHGFDDLGRQFDLNGNLIEWWKSETKAHFLNRTRCIIDQYGKFTEPSINKTLNGINTQGENIADNGGMKEAYLAYNKWTERHGSENLLPGLPYTQQQLFWISAAQTWCSTARSWYIKMTIATDSHAPNRFRVLGSMQNNKDFSKDFKCSLGSPMNPIKKYGI